MEIGKCIIRENDLYLIGIHYRNLWLSLLKKYNLDGLDMFVRKWLWLMYSEDSAYVNIGICERGLVIHKMEEFSPLSLVEYEGEVSKFSSFADELLGLFESQEERVYRKLKERIDNLVTEYSNSVVKLEDLENEPKKVKAISDLLSIKEKLQTGIKKGLKNRGDKKESLIENM